MTMIRTDIASPATEPSTAVALARAGWAEWLRIRSVRSTWAFAGATAVVVLGFASILAQDVANDPQLPDVTAWTVGQFAGMFALFGIVAIASVTATADHGTGGIVPTLQWTPRRGLLLTARVVAVAGASTVLGLVLVTAASVVGLLWEPRIGLPVDGAGVLVGVAFVYAASTLLATGLGLALRNTAGVLVLVVALMLVLPIVLTLFGEFGFEWAVDARDLLPGAGALHLLLTDVVGSPFPTLTDTAARLVLGAWSLGALVAGGWRLLRSDADR